MSEQGLARSLISITGADREKFLQGLVTNDVTHAHEALIYAAMLTPQGKYLADFFLLERNDEILLDIATPLAAGLLQRLTMYKLRADVTLAMSELGVSRGTGPAPEGAYPDPRHPSLGWRAYGQNTATTSDDTDWDAVRVANVIPESGIELVPNETFILEAGFERLNGVDFKKGCYVGQEVTARMKHKTELKKGFARVAIQGEASADGEILADGKPAGRLLTRAGDSAIAYLRFERAGGNMTCGAANIQRK